MRLWITLIVAVLLASPAGAVTYRLIGEKSLPSNTEQSEIRRVVEAQLAAFPRGEAETAFSYASPSIRRQFGTAEAFMAMVRKSYATVFRAKQVFFRDLVATPAGPMQPVLIIDAAGVSAVANYLMQRQSDGSWRINGVVLQPVSNQGI